MNTFEMAEDTLLEFCRWERLARETRERWALICATAGETEVADLLRNIDAEPLEESA